MGRKTTKSILSRDEISLLLNSEEPKNIELYGNLYSVLCDLQKLKAVTLEQLPDIDSKAKAALTYNKKTLIDIVIKEWYAEKVSEEDPAKKIRCGLCNTPNKYLFYIRNRKNNTLLNVGSRCITKFPGIEGYIEQKKQLSQIQKEHQIVNRRNEFYDHFPDYENYIFDAEKYFSTLPILLPYKLYLNLQNTIKRMRLIAAKYINEGKKPYESQYDAFGLFQLAINNFTKLKTNSDNYVNKNKDKPLVCKRPEIDWLISENKTSLLQQISENEGLYTLSTLKNIYSIEFIKRNLELILLRNNSDLIKFERLNDNSLIFSFNKFGYQPSILFNANLKDFMQHIGANCIINNAFTYGSNEILSISTINNSKINLSSIIEYIDNMMNLLNCVFLVDDASNSLYLYRKGDRAVRQLSYYTFMRKYSKYILLPDKEIKKFLLFVVKENSVTKWVTTEMQSKQGIYEKIDILYKDYKQLHENNLRPTGRVIELMTYSIYNDSVTNTPKLDFNSSEYIALRRDKLKISNSKLRFIEYGLRIIDESLSPLYHKGDILFVQSIQKLKTDAVLFFASADKIIIHDFHLESEDHVSIFKFSSIPKKELVAYGKITYCYHHEVYKQNKT